MPDRAKTRFFCASGEAVTTTIASTLRRALLDKGVARRPDERMNDGLQFGHRRRIAEHARAKRGAIDDAIDDHAGKSGGDRRDRRATIEIMHDTIGIENGDAGVAEHLRRRRFAHADRPGESDA